MRSICLTCNGSALRNCRASKCKSFRDCRQPAWKTGISIHRTPRSAIHNSAHCVSGQSFLVLLTSRSSLLSITDSSPWCSQPACSFHQKMFSSPSYFLLNFYPRPLFLTHPSAPFMPAENLHLLLLYILFDRPSSAGRASRPARHGDAGRERRHGRGER